MSDFEIKVDMLISSLNEKNEALKTVLNITENQSLIFTSEKTAQMWDLFSQMNETKQEGIDRVIELDSLFQGIFESISEGFEKNALQIREKTIKLQVLISEALELDIKIRAAEQKNRQAVSEMKKVPKPVASSSKADLLKKYEKNKKRPADS